MTRIGLIFCATLTILSNRVLPAKLVGNNCCDLLYFGSTGSLAGSGQNHVIGNYEKLNEGPEGHWNYKQQGGKLFLYYLPGGYNVGI
jgi:hypothetical protein